MKTKPQFCKTTIAIGEAKKRTVRPSIVLGAILLLVLSSCAQYKAVQPVYPMPPLHLESGKGYGGILGAAPTVDSLQPTLAWKSEGSSQTRYDIIIYTAIPKPVRNVVGLALGYYFVPGKRVYYRESIEGGSHRIEEPLDPGGVYVWSVRTHSGSNIGPWSTYDFQRGLPYVEGESGKNLWWSFRTPKP